MRFQVSAGAIPASMIRGIIKGINTVLKYGGPTEIFPIPKASINNGYKVPRRTVAAAEAAVGLAIIVMYYKNKGSIQVEHISSLKG